MSTQKQYAATIFIPTLNAEEYLNDLLTMCFRQTYARPFEVFIIDSGSTDNTLRIIKKDFGHGKTRQLAAEMSNSEFMAFLTQDAVPAHDQWLSQMLYPFEVGEKIIAVLGRQIPRTNSMPITKRDVTVVFEALGPGHFITIQSKNPLNTSGPTQDANTFFSNVNAAVRRNFLIMEFGIPDVNYGEDRAFSKKLLDNGWFKAYSPQGSVIHSHTYPIKGYYQRIVDETQALATQGSYKSKTSPWSIVAHTLYGIRDDSIFIIRDRDYTFKQKIKWIIKTPGYNAARQYAMYKTLGSYFTAKNAQETS
jgi:rhamnosyltransferase